MYRALIATTLLLLSNLTTQSYDSTNKADAALDRFFNSFLDAWFTAQPLTATTLGDHRFDSGLDDLSAPARNAWQKQVRRFLKELPRQVAREQLSPQAQLDFEILERELQKTLWIAENTKPYEEDPRSYSDYISDSVYLLLAQSTLPAETNIANTISRMAKVPSVLQAARDNLRNPPRVHTETAIRQNQGAIEFYEAGILDLVGQSPQLPALRETAARLVASLRDYQQFLEKELLPQATGDWRLGKVRFSRKLALELDAGLTADQVLADAEAEFARVRRDMYVVARQLWGRCYPKEPLPPDDAAGREETTRRVLVSIAQDRGTPETLVEDIRGFVAGLKTFITERDILQLPEPDTCQIVEMPEFKRGNSTAYMNSPPPLDPKAKGFFAVSPPPSNWAADRVRSYLEEYNRHMQKILAIHEAYPGHYVQLEYANRNPSLIRKVFGSGVYIEGWAVYTEQTMLDQGYGDGDPALRLTQLKFYLRAVCNAILDHKMHCASMTDEQAMDLLAGQAFQSEGEARLKVIRAKQSSVQLSTYFAGRMAMYRLRQQIQRELGSNFNLGRYHEAVLSLGAVPVKHLPALVRKKVAGAPNSESRIPKETRIPGDPRRSSGR
jgi:uncharacterized protein (DUF885 family)